MNQQSRIQRLLEDVLAQPGNDKCADCHAPSPRWASTNLGIFLCVQCASQHRRLGTHNSRVKSVTLDEWTREQVVHMRSIGNTKSNAIFNPDERRHPPPLQVGEERDSELFKYIRRKYELGAFKAGAAPALSQVPINSRVTQQQARNVSGGAQSIRSNHTGSTKSPATPTFGTQPFAPKAPPKRPELADIVVSRERDLPALPSPPPKPKTTGLAPPPTRARAPTWSGDGLAPPRPTPCEEQQRKRPASE
ncbi:ARF GAP-like zinc finger-containing protein-like protein [Trichosporon asahii var. asahii CBS 8904]|uniref:ARF GAP-like zinc finger-containing protein-like protein n=1 Tax=Trichosporon asahii var. asahii (strain CBS 8904) TaxID=1220162 RepID=K1W711_TRIAC|nr:ARF GAP-like zinc finger-containing protein-like protein [Trichosporon asahii var. asahii CBS 8904]